MRSIMASILDYNTFLPVCKVPVHARNPTKSAPAFGLFFRVFYNFITGFRQIQDAGMPFAPGYGMEAARRKLSHAAALHAALFPRTAPAKPPRAERLQHTTVFRSRAIRRVMPAGAGRVSGFPWPQRSIRLVRPAPSPSGRPTRAFCPRGRFLPRTSFHRMMPHRGRRRTARFRRAKGGRCKHKPQVLPPRLPAVHSRPAPVLTEPQKYGIMIAGKLAFLRTGHRHRHRAPCAAVRGAGRDFSIWNEVKIICNI